MRVPQTDTFLQKQSAQRNKGTSKAYRPVSGLSRISQESRTSKASSKFVGFRHVDQLARAYESAKQRGVAVKFSRKEKRKARRRYKSAKDFLTKDLWELEVDESEHIIGKIVSKNIFRLPSKDMTCTRATSADMTGYFIKPSVGPFRNF